MVECLPYQWEALAVVTDWAEGSGLCVSEVRGLFEPCNIQNVNGNIGATSNFSAVSLPLPLGLVFVIRKYWYCLRAWECYCHRYGKVLIAYKDRMMMESHGKFKNLLTQMEMVIVESLSLFWEFLWKRSWWIMRLIMELLDSFIIGILPVLTLSDHKGMSS